MITLQNPHIYASKKLWLADLFKVPSSINNYYVGCIIKCKSGIKKGWHILFKQKCNYHSINYLQIPLIY